MIVAYQGVPGAFGEEAAAQVEGAAELLPCATFADVVEAVERGAADRGVLPVANSLAGDVDGVADLIAASSLRVAASLPVAVRLHLLARPGASLQSIDTVVSHPMALRQCSRFLADLDATSVEAANTAVAARSIADDRTAALASPGAADLYGLQPLALDCQDADDNVTTFAVLARR